MKYRKIGGLHFFQISRLTFSFCISKPKNQKLEKIKQLKRRISKAKADFKSVKKLQGSACGMSAQERAAYWKARQAAQIEADRMGDMVTAIRMNGVNENRVFHGFKSV